MTGRRQPARPGAPRRSELVDQRFGSATRAGKTLADDPATWQAIEEARREARARTVRTVLVWLLMIAAVFSAAAAMGWRTG